MTAREATSFSQSLHAGAVVVEAHGELDVATAPAFRTAVRNAVDTGRALVVVDLGHVSFLDSAALSVLFAAQRGLPLTQRITLVEVPERMRRMLRVSGVDAVVDVHGPGAPRPWLDDGGNGWAAGSSPDR
ncbi:STAS domain-containing protein [uncultured Cellulomonas sp.]|uniref:STAS domain-containing protein n=1 Tax=uncultured Cellulomonas sp. TaxID=189682 RepID=UPI00261E88C2|nr:STAS domain-containing protein [uncultured Cellulomonas sp.]